MKIQSLILVILLLAMTSPALAQQPTPSEPPVTTPPEPRLIIEPLLWGAEYFPFPTWNISVQASSLELSITWQTAADFFAITSYNQQFGGFTDLSGEEISQMITPQWLEVVLQGYETYAEVERCFDEEFLTIELNTVDQGAEYVGRYWVWANEGVFTSILAMYPPTQAAALEAFADGRFGGAARCEP